MRGLGITGASIAAALAVCAAAPWASEGMIQPFASLAPPMHVDGFDPGALENGNVFVTVLPGRGRELAVVAAMRTTAPPQRLIAWMRRVHEIFRTPPQKPARHASRPRRTDTWWLSVPRWARGIVDAL